MSALDPDIVCRECQIGQHQQTRGAYNFHCADCLARYVYDMLKRISGDKFEIVRKKLIDRLSERIGK